jgi:hypothetical protein
MSKTNEYTDQSYSVGSGSGNVAIHKFESKGKTYYYISGEIHTRNGFVMAYSEENHTSLRFIFNGRIYLRTWRNGFAGKTLTKLAKQFSDEVTAE